MDSFLYDYDYGLYEIPFIDSNTINDWDVNLEDRFANLTSWQWEQIQNYTLSGQMCLLNQWAAPLPEGKWVSKLQGIDLLFT